ncbi:acyl-CoA dehydrogenase family protein [Streptomyces sp. NPDC058694]|uniref:acyl-CoA dehydrogenase family protein n=1 Tax=Streptomyces sp. NPDC058694 TaxID=3346603 RepID=UPI0036565059
MLVQAAAHALDAEDTDADVAARTALAAAADAVEAVTADDLQTHGGIGFTWEHRSHVLLRRARARRPLLGSPTTGSTYSPTVFSGRHTSPALLIEEAARPWSGRALATRTNQRSRCRSGSRPHRNGYGSWSPTSS